ncbi:MAG: BON domain-containing protein [Nitrospirae bacterium]|nr:BON domain-containing protein [Nitrospirota bacterium]
MAIMALFNTAPAWAVTPEPGDFWIETTLKSLMEHEGYLDAGRITVSAHDGSVRLDGLALSPEEKGAAELLATQVSGVTAVMNNIRVVEELNRDLAIERESRSTLEEAPLLHIRALQLFVKNGLITLHGIVPSKQERRLACRFLTMLPGVDGVIDHLEVVRHA